MTKIDFKLEDNMRWYNYLVVWFPRYFRLFIGLPKTDTLPYRTNWFIGLIMLEIAFLLRANLWGLIVFVFLGVWLMFDDMVFYRLRRDEILFEDELSVVTFWHWAPLWLLQKIGL